LTQAEVIAETFAIRSPPGADVKKFLLVLIGLALIPVASSLARGQPSGPNSPGHTTSSIDNALRELSASGPPRVHANEPLHSPGDEGSGFAYRPNDLYTDCADAMDSLTKTKEPVDDRLLQLADKGKELPERYRAVWVLIQRRNKEVIPALEKMAASTSAEERFLAWIAYGRGVRHGHITAPRSFEAALRQCRDEKNRHVRSALVGFFGACKAKEAVPFLVAALENDAEPNAIDALGEICDPNTVPAIVTCLKKKATFSATHNRHSYFRALGHIGTPEAVEYLIECLDEGCFAVESLFESGSPKALPAIEKHLNRLQAKKQPDELDLAVAQVSALRLKHADPREHLFVLAEDRKQSQWMRTRALEALGHYDKKPVTERLLKLYRAEPDDWTRMFCIRLLRDLPGNDITEALIDQALTDRRNVYYFSHADLLEALNQRLGTSFRTMASLTQHLQRERDAKDR
jgi:HEAT repeat protein